MEKDIQIKEDNNKIEYLYTWKDVERKINLYISDNKDKIPPYLVNIEVYPEDFIITVNEDDRYQDVQDLLKEIFNKNFDRKRKCIRLDQFGSILYQEYGTDLHAKRSDWDRLRPLFKNIAYQENAYDGDYFISKQLSKCPVIAFHSYKGGVGRTLSLLAFAKAWTSVRRGEKLLIVDSDIEAPGLTWFIQEEIPGEQTFSYLDLLELVQSGEIQKENVMQGVIDLVSQTTIPIEAERVITEHYFLPTYRYKEQILEIYSSPESVAANYHTRYLLAELLSDLAAQIGASAVLIDLRAGLSEFSAPILFDPRVKKYIVTSTSLQSIQGTKILLELMQRGLIITENTILPEILMTMVPEGLDTSDLKSDLIKEIDDIDSKFDYTDTLVTELPFASELIHLPSLNQIMKKLEGRDFYKNLYEFVLSRYEINKANSDFKKFFDKREQIIHKIHELASAQVTAEGHTEFPVLLTKAIRNLIGKYAAIVPQAVVLGAKGAGKTFLFKSMLYKKTWNNFLETFNVTTRNLPQTYLLPLISPGDVENHLEIIKGTVSEFMDHVVEAGGNPQYWHDNVSVITKFNKEDHAADEWTRIWLACISSAFKETDLGIVDQKLGEKNQRVLFLVDGLELYFEKTLDRESEQNAIRGLVRGTVEELKVKYNNIGLIVFLRKDLASNAISTNFEQFESQYRSLMLNWSQNEALRMALWLVSKAVPDFCQRIDLENENAPSNVIEEKLNELWGVKLGKNNSNEAYSSRWILAALSDFNLQLQARDIMRFLKYATEKPGKPNYEDRILMPKEIKWAVGECSKEKITEIEAEIAVLKPIFEELRNAPEDKKELPFHADTFNWDAKKEKLLKQEGFLRENNDKYYLPEIIRHALGFKYRKGARPKVISLLLK